jgi:gluconolactonase
MKTLWRFEPISGRFGFTEGPVWDGTAVLFVDMFASRIVRYDPTAQATTTFAENTNGANGLALDDDGRLYVCESAAGRVVRYDRAGDRAMLAGSFEGRRLNSPNDIIVDRQRRVWFTDPRYGDRTTMALAHDSVYRLDPQVDGGYSITRVTFDTIRPNGLALSPDETTLYVAESPPAPDGVRQLRAYPVRADGTLGEMRVLHDFGPHRGIDGMRVDRGGNIVAAAGWATSGPGPRIAVFDSEGTLIAEHPMRAEPTNCCFDGDYRTVYVTAKDGRLYRAGLDD